MSALNNKSPLVHIHDVYDSLYQNPLINDDPHHPNPNSKHTRRNRSDGGVYRGSRTLGYELFGDSNNKENVFPTHKHKHKHKHTSDVVVVPVALGDKNATPPPPPLTNRNLFKSSSLQLCMLQQQQHSDSSTLGLGGLNPNVWDQYSDSEAAPASSWSALPNRYLLCRPLPLDIGRCTCIILKEPSTQKQGLNAASLYSLYTHEGDGRRDRKLAVACHTRKNGRSQFTVAHNSKGLSSNSDETLLGTITANFMGSKYHIWDQANSPDPLKIQSKLLVAVVGFVPTITTCTGSFRSLRAWIPKHQSMQLKTTSKSFQHIYGLPHDWEAKAQPLYSRVPHYNSFSRQYELDFRERGRAANKVQSSVKNFQLTVEENGRHSILQLGKVAKSKYVMEYRYPLTGYQAFCICLASIDTKLCCTV